MYVVRFTQKDGLPVEDYCYNNYYDALSHYNIFKDDDCTLYEYIILLKDEEILLSSQ